MKNKILLKTVFFQSMILAVLIVMPVSMTYANEGKCRSISVVYDDSGSMIHENGVSTDRWCQAKYAMEVFAAMMDTQDTLNIFPMSAEDAGTPFLTVYGSDAAEKRVSSIHDMETNAGETPYSTVTSAYQYLESQEADEKWLIVLTDGEFENGKKPVKEIDNDFRKFVETGVRIVYLSMSDSAKAISEDRANNIFYYNAPQSTEILYKLTEIANLIFERQILGDQYITKQGDNVILNLDVPMENLIVFSQGRNITVGEITGSASDILNVSHINVRYSDKVNPNYADRDDISIKIADNLSGVVAEYQGNTADNLIAEGQYSMEISDSSDLQIYYKLAVDVDITLNREGVLVDVSEGNIEAGDYTGQIILRNPISGEELHSDLLKDVTYQVDIQNGSNQQSFHEASFEIPLDAGDLDIQAQVWLNEDTSVANSLESTVVVPINEFSIQCSEKGEPFLLDHLTEKENGIRIRATEGGEPLPEEIWRNASLQVTTDAAVEFEIVPGDEVSTWILYPLPHVDLNSTQTGEINFQITARMLRDGQEAEAKAEGRLTIAAEALPVTVTCQSPEEPYDVHTLEGETRGIVADVLLDGQHFTPEEWETAEAEVTSGQRVQFRVEKGTGDNVSQIFIYPEISGSLAGTSEGLIQFQVKVSFDRYGTVCEGTGNGSFQMLGLTLLEKVRKYIFFALAFLFVLGYAPFGNPFGKSYLTKRNLAPYSEMTEKTVTGGTKRRTHYPGCTISKWMYLIPYKNIEATIESKVPGTGHKIFPAVQIRAVRGGALLIRNLRALADKGVLLDHAPITFTKPKDRTGVVTKTSTFTFKDSTRMSHTMHFQ